ncbi:MAG: hypothetical protein IJH32_01550 [Ruminococcus sp.]|nr:hypothetical protein [Ruminococcus sp.]
MKKILAITFVLLMIVAVLAGCAKKAGETAVSTNVPAKYVDDFAKKYASDVKVDDDGNVSYSFTDEQYEQFENDYRSEVKKEAEAQIQTYGQYSYITNDGTEYIVGIMPEAYDEEACKAEAEVVGKYAIKYIMNTDHPQNTIKVTYENCQNNEDYFTIEVSAD